MKVRDISLVATAAIISVALIALIFTLFNPPNVQANVAASCSGTPGAGAMIVTASDNNGPNAGNGVITINDSTTKKVTVVSYLFATGSINGPTVTLSSAHSFTYQ